MILLPAELPDLRLRMVSELSTERGRFVMRTLGGKSFGDGEFSESLDREISTFEEATLLHVGPDLVDLLFSARHGMGESGIMDYDLPMPMGMAYLAKKFPAYEERVSLRAHLDSIRADLEKLPPELRAEHLPWLEDRERQLEESRLEQVAEMNWDEHLLMLWRYEAPSPTYEYGSIRLSWYLERDAWWEWCDTLYRTMRGDGFDTRAARSKLQLPPFVFDGCTVIACHPDAAQVKIQRFDAVDSESDQRFRRVDLFRALAYLLRQDNVVSSREELPSRPARRRAAREGRVAPSVRVLALRGVGSGGAGGGAGREYAHRWVVRGHWRRQWYPSIRQHRPRWIMPFIKGPEDAPLLGGEKVYVAKSPSS